MSENLLSIWWLSVNLLLICWRWMSVNLLSDMEKRLTTNRASDWLYIRSILTLLPFIIVLVLRTLMASIGCGCRWSCCRSGACLWICYRSVGGGCLWICGLSVGYWYLKNLWSICWLLISKKSVVYLLAIDI